MTGGSGTRSVAAGAVPTIARAVLAGLTACGTPAAAPAPARCPDRAVVLASQADVARLASCSTLRGLTVRSGAALDLSPLRALAAVTGDVRIGPTLAVEDVALPALRTVGGALRVVGNGVLQRVHLPALERVGPVVIDGNPAIKTISLARLRAVHGALHITDNAELELADLAALEAVDQALVITGDPGLSLVDAERLQHAAAVQLDAPRLPPDVAERLRATAR